MDDYLAFAKDLAPKAGKLIRDNTDAIFDVELKSDKTPVTQIDKEINTLVSQAIQKTYPEHGLMGEEMSHGTDREELQWLCDPLDGTKSFIIGAPLSTFILGLTKGGQVLLAVVYDPFTDRLYHAVKGQGAFCNDQTIHVNKKSLSDAGYILLSESSLQFSKSLKNVGAQTEFLPGGGYRCTVLANGRCSGIIQSRADFHDVGPASLLVEGAGGKVTDFSGASLRYDQALTNGIILSNGICHDSLLEVVRAQT